jgi:hypothetical protein
MATLTLYGNTLTLYSSPLALYAGAVVTAPIQGGWGTYDTREDERRQARVDRDKAAEERKRRKAVEQAFQALDVRPETPAEVIAPQVKAEIRAVALPKIDLSGIGVSLDRVDALIDAMWAERQAEMAAQAEAEAALWRKQEEEALMVLLLAA